MITMFTIYDTEVLYFLVVYRCAVPLRTNPQGHGLKHWKSALFFWTLFI